MREWESTLLDAVFERCDNLFAIIDRDLKLLSSSQAWKETFLTADEPGINLLDIFSAPIRDGIGDGLRSALDDGQSHHSKSVPIITATGSAVTFKVIASRVRENLLVEFVPDAAIDRASFPDDLYRQAVEAVNDAIIITTPELDAPHPLIEYVNPAFSAMTGYLPHEIRGQSPRVLQGPMTDRTMISTIKDRLRERATFEGESYNYRKDGTPYYVEWRIAAIRGKDGEPTHWLATQRDITHRKQSEETLKRLNENLEMRVKERTRELEDANREIASFSYTVSHDLRSPLRSILGFSRALEEDYREQLTAEARDYLDRMTGAARRMDELITVMLNLARLSRVELQITTCDVSDVAAIIVRDIGDNYPDIEFRIDPGLEMKADCALLRAVLHNLLENAAKFSAESERKTVDVTSETRDGRRYIVIRDYGVGFEQSKAERIFQPFERLYGKGPVQGSGIGLATVSRIVARHRGRVFAESSPGQGAAFYVTLEPNADSSTE